MLQSQSQSQSQIHVTLVATNLWSGQIDVFDDYLPDDPDPNVSLYGQICQKYGVCSASHQTINFTIWPV